MDRCIKEVFLNFQNHDPSIDSRFTVGVNRVSDEEIVTAGYKYPLEKVTTL